MDFIELTSIDNLTIYIAGSAIVSIYQQSKEDCNMTTIKTLGANNNVYYVKETPSEIFDKLRNMYGNVRTY